MLNECKKIAKKRGGECLSNTYVNQHLHLRWKCKYGHIWKAPFRHIKHKKTWCPECSINNKKLGIESLQSLAKSHDGKLISTNYINSKTKYLWQCKFRHEWEALYDNIKAGKWCPECAGNKKLSLSQMKKIAKNKGGKCLSKEYINANTKLKWQCAYGHVWNTSPRFIIKGRWCHQCNEKVSEGICRDYFESLFGKKFIKIRPKWLSYNGSNLELDGYCPSINIAFEHNGMQHYKQTFFHKNKNDFLNQLERDKAKQKICKELGIKLIIIPQLFEITKVKDLRNFIINQCKYMNINIPHKKAEIKFKKIDKIQEFKEIANKNGGKCLSNKYMGTSQKLKFQCKCGRVWNAWPSNIRCGHWCASCGNKRQ